MFTERFEMARKVTISRDIILENGLKMLIRDGYSAVNIKSLAAEIGCSTQPLVWHFENMEGLRKALAEYARQYSKDRAVIPKGTSVEAIEAMGKNYVEMALKEPNLFRFLYLGQNPLGNPFRLEDVVGVDGGAKLLADITRETGISGRSATRCIWNTVIYSHGIATMIVTGVLKTTESAAMAMVEYATDSFLRKEGARR